MRYAFRQFMKRLFGIPNTPSSLPMDFCSKPGDYTWEDWKRDSKAKYPVRYFLSETIPLWFSVKIFMPIEEFIYWFKSVTYRRYHMLDLRQPKTNQIGSDHYRWGWIDEDQQMLYACFNILVSHVNVLKNADYGYGIDDIEQLKVDLAKNNEEYKAYGIIPEDVETNSQVLHLQEVKALYEYWTVERQKLWQEIDQAAKTATSKQFTELREEFFKIEDEMMIRLMKIRRGLWT